MAQPKKKISNPNTITITITITITEITDTDFRSTFSLSKSQSKHKFQIYDFHFSLSEIINTNTNTNSHEWVELNPKKRKKNGDSARSTTVRTKQSWDLRETGMARTKLPPSLLKSVGTARTVLPSVKNGSPASSCLMSSWCSSRYTYGLWSCMWDRRRWKMKRWEAVSERAEEMRGMKGWNEERNWKFRVLILYIYKGNLVILYII